MTQETPQKYLKADKQLHSKWLSWEKLFKAGLSEEEADKWIKEKYLTHIRTETKDLPDEVSQAVLIRFLMEKRYYKLNAARLLVGDFNYKSLYSIKRFIEGFYEHMKHRNNMLSHYLIRGYTPEEGREAIRLFCDNSKGVQERRDRDPEYDQWFKETRKPGAIASSISLKRQENRSKFEIELINLLESLGYSSKRYFTPVFDNPEQKNYVHDGYIENSIIEYNGGYWHKDHFRFPNRFSLDQYKEEIQKALYCLDFKRENNPNYILIWEKDFSGVEEAANFVISCILNNTKGEFYSSRKEDLNLLQEIKSQKAKDESIDSNFMNIAREFAKRSKCVSRQVCSLIVKNKRIISTGLNGTPPGLPNCNEIFNKNNFDRETHHKWSLNNEIHSEVAAIANCAREGIALEGSTIYVTLEPCMNCAKMIIGAGIKKLVYGQAYDKGDPSTLDFLRTSGVEVRLLEDSIKK